MRIGPVERHFGRWRVFQRDIKTEQRLARVFKRIPRIVDLAAVMAAHEKKAHRFAALNRIEFVQHFAQREKIANRLRHFLLVKIEECGVHPIARELSSARAFRLGNFIFMMWKLQIPTAAVNINLFAKHFTAHCRALDMPAGAAITKYRRPFRLVRLGGLPQHKIKRITLGRGHGNALTGLQFINIFARQFAVVGKAAHRIKHVTRLFLTAAAVRDTFFLENANHIEHGVNVLGRTRTLHGPQ